MKMVISLLAWCLPIIFLFSACSQTDACTCQVDGGDCFCYEIYQPVCGCDGVTYANDCYQSIF